MKQSVNSIQCYIDAYFDDEYKELGYDFDFERNIFGWGDEKYGEGLELELTGFEFDSLDGLSIKFNKVNEILGFALFVHQMKRYRQFRE
jgi:hypothetical protein